MEYGMKSYLELVEHGTPLHQEGPQSPRETLLELIDFCEYRPPLEMASPWRLAPAAARELEEATGYAPEGGWGNFVTLAAAGGFFAVKNEGILCVFNRHTVEKENTAADVQKKLLEGFTRWLAPPQTMAGLLVGLGLHPMWGLRVAHEVRARHFGGHMELKDSRIFPPNQLAIVEEMIFGAIAAIFGVLQELDPKSSYPVDALAQVIAASMHSSRITHAERILNVHGALPVFVDEVSRSGCYEFSSSDFLRAVLVPSGAACLVPHERFAVAPGAFEGLRIGILTEDAQRSCLEWLKAESCASMVA